MGPSSGAATIVGAMGNVVAITSFLMPSSIFYKVIVKKSTEESRPDPHIGSLLNCLVWTIYGLPMVCPNNLFVLIANGVGVVLESIHLTIYFIYGPPEGKKKVKICIWIVIIIVMVTTIMLIILHDIARRNTVVGIMGILFTVIKYSLALIATSKETNSKSVDSVPLLFSFVSFINNCIWTTYAIIKRDLFLMISNGIGILIGAAQVILHGNKSTPTSN